MRNRMNLRAQCATITLVPICDGVIFCAVLLTPPPGDLLSASLGVGGRLVALEGFLSRYV